MNHEELSRHIAEFNPRLSPLFSLEFGDAVVGVELNELHVIAAQLKELGFDRLGMVTVVHRPPVFVMVYRLQSRSLSTGLFLKTQLSDVDAIVPTMCDLWPAANWQEREVFDMFGIRFEGHPDMRRMLLPDDFVGHPLRKDYDDPRVIKRPDYI